MIDTNFAQLSATITISGADSPFSVSAPNVVDMRQDSGTPNPAIITYTLAPDSAAAGFSLGDVVVKTTGSADITLLSHNATTIVFQDMDSDATEDFKFGFYYWYKNVSYYYDPDVENEEPR
ncbi:MAG: hypothetical protein KDI66_10190 [Xanthomonadales bacterium]|nr:hypothetical protein [Xanthomonadales bacterium]